MSTRRVLSVNQEMLFNMPFLEMSTTPLSSLPPFYYTSKRVRMKTATYTSKLKRIGIQIERKAIYKEGEA